MPTTPPPAALATARFKTLSGSDKIEVDVHFNPASLQYTLSNTQKEEGTGAKKKQYVSQTTAKLSMDLVFDTTDTGEDVRGATDKMAKLMRPYKEGAGRVPPLVEFGWGVYRFTGTVDQYRETIDFFAAGGVPLRSSISITLSSQDAVFDSNKNPAASVDGAGGIDPVVIADQSGALGGAFGIAVSLGDPRSARAIASFNGSATLRFGAGGDMAVGGGVTLTPAAAFSAGGGFGAGAGIGIGAGAGIGISAGAGIGVGLSASAGAGAGVDFSGLRASAGGSAAMPDGRALLQTSATAGVGGSAQFGLGGCAQVQGAASLGADVGADADLGARITFK